MARRLRPTGGRERPHAAPRGPVAGLFRRRRRAAYAPVPPHRLPPGRTVVVPDRGEVFVRDSGGSGPVVLLLHGWMFASDLNWGRHYAPLAAAGYRVLALDLRGHGHGLRSSEPFRLTDCADDAAGLLAELGLRDVLAVGYSMGGPVAALLAQRAPDRVAGLVLCATALDWQDARQKAFWRTMGALRVVLGAFPLGLWRAVVRAQGLDEQYASWVVGELSRSSARDLAEAGRELSRFDAAGWIGALPQRSAVVLMERDRLVPPRKQQALADALGVAPLRLDADHSACSNAPQRFVSALLDGLAAVRPRAVA